MFQTLNHTFEAKLLCRKLCSIRFSSYEDMSDYVTGLFHTFENTWLSVFEHVLHNRSSSELLNQIKRGDVMHK